ncbi:PspA/IM30 family protein [Paenibacillus lutimineralis]|uniref:PspA/IM30 family protein n=1 Tax=Paenibacillus lutimineralis TaxID=2707005 RepID=A0A3S9USU8_9BACL|nr:PspA/IM30 family protein [Paenibacillus lutimineralis]AZS13334.1 PspA/IM30 family protein [Paenibacillus lutimineralis]
MGIFSRLKNMTRANVNSWKDQSDEPEKSIDEYLRSLNSDLGKVKAETASLLAEERRAKNALDECCAEIIKMQRYADKSVEAGNEDESRKFLEQAKKLGERLSDLQNAYNLASSKAASMKQVQDRLIVDLAGLEQRRIELKGKLAEARLQQEVNSDGLSSGQASFREIEEQMTQAIHEAEALAELRKDDPDNK